MADISKVNVNNTKYNLKDSSARTRLITAEDALAEVINSGAKNVLKTYGVPSTTTGNVTYSVSSGVVTVSISGTQSTAKVLLYAMDSDVGNTTVNSRNTIPKGTYILKTTGNGKVKLRAIEHDGTTTNLLTETTGADAEFTYTGAMPYVTFTLSVSSNTSLSEPLTFMPMCCLKSLYSVDSTAEPYALPNPTLTPAVIKAVDEGAKNLFQTDSGSTICRFLIQCNCPAGAYHIYVGSIASTDTDKTTCKIALLSGEGEVATLQATRGSGYSSDIILSSDCDSAYIYASNTFNNSANDTITFTNAMLCTAHDWAVSQKFVPYCPSLPEVYEEVQEIKNVGLVSATVPSATANVLEYTGLSITIPKSSIALVGACDTYNNSKPVGLVLSLNSDPSTTTATPASYLLYTIEGVSTGQNKVDFVTTIHNTSSSNSMTVYLHAKRANVNSTGNKTILWYHIIS